MRLKMTLISITDPDDPRVAAFRHVKERDLTGREGRFIAEGKGVVRLLASPASRCEPEALLLAENRVEAMADVVAALPAVPTYVAGQAVLDAIAGFHLHRGVLALGRKPAPCSVAEVLAGAASDAVVVCAIGIGNHDNIGGLFRNAAAFGAHAVLMDAGCCDPFYRKAIRVSVGAVLRTPMATATTAEAMLDDLEAAGFEVLALSPSATEPLSAVRGGGRQALLLGAEGPGLPDAVMRRCRAVGILMAGGFDSLNVAATSAVALHQLTQGSTITEPSAY